MTDEYRSQIYTDLHLTCDLENLYSIYSGKICVRNMKYFVSYLFIGYYLLVRSLCSQHMQDGLVDFLQLGAATSAVMGCVGSIQENLSGGRKHM